MLRYLPDESLAISLGHPVARLDPLTVRDRTVEMLLKSLLPGVALCVVLGVVFRSTHLHLGPLSHPTDQSFGNVQCLLLCHRRQPHFRVAFRRSWPGVEALPCLASQLAAGHLFAQQSRGCEALAQAGVEILG